MASATSGKRTFHQVLSSDNGILSAGPASQKRQNRTDPSAQETPSSQSLGVVLREERPPGLFTASTGSHESENQSFAQEVCSPSKEELLMAQFEVAQQYVQGSEVDLDEVENGLTHKDRGLFALSKLAITQNHVLAMWEIGLHYIRKDLKNSEKNIEKGLYWCEKAACQHLTEPQQALLLNTDPLSTSIYEEICKLPPQLKPDSDSGKVQYDFGNLHSGVPTIPEIPRDLNKQLKWHIIAIQSGSKQAHKGLLLSLMREMRIARTNTTNTEKVTIWQNCVNTFLTIISLYTDEEFKRSIFDIMERLTGRQHMYR